jgi:hypothetical protein
MSRLPTWRTPSAALFALALALVLPASLRAAPPVVSLGGPEVVKLDWATRGLTPADLDGDGRMDLAIIDNDRASIELLYQIKPGTPPDPAKPARANRWEPVLEDARFRRVSVTTGETMFDLAVGDLNGDGRPDLIYTGEVTPLTIRYQQADGAWLEKKIPEAPEPVHMLSTLCVADLRGSGRKDLVMLGQKELAIFYQQPDGTLAPPVRLALTDENCYGLMVCDVNGDGRPDIVYLASGKHDVLRVRLQTADHQFGPELSYPINPNRSTLQLLAAATKAGPARFVYAQNPTGQLGFFSLEAADGKKTDLGPRPQVFTPFAAGKTGAASYAFGDFSGDGREDVAMSDPDGAQVFIYFRQPDGGFTTPKKFPSLSGVRSLAAADWEGHGRAALFVASPKEEVLGIATVNADGRLGYPVPLNVPGRPLAVAAGDLAGDGKVGVVVLLENKGERSLAILQRQPDGAAKIIRTITLAGLKTDPRAIKLVDAAGNHRLDIAVFTPLDAMRLYVQNADGSFTDAAGNPDFHKSFVNDLDAAAVGAGDPDGAGGPGLLVSTGAFTRELRLDEKGALTIADQFNARDSTAEIAAAFMLPAGKKGSRPDVLLYDHKDGQFQRLRAGQDGVYEVTDVTPAGKIDVVGAETRIPSRGAAPELFLLGKDRFWWLPPGRGEFTVGATGTYTTDLPEVSYSDVAAGDLTGDGQPDLVAVDVDQNLVEILARDPATKAWTSQMHFKVFEADQHFEGRKGSPQEPRETLIAPVAANGKNALILLVHDRILIYPQQ